VWRSPPPRGVGPQPELSRSFPTAPPSRRRVVVLHLITFIFSRRSSESSSGWDFPCLFFCQRNSIISSSIWQQWRISPNSRRRSAFPFFFVSHLRIAATAFRPRPAEASGLVYSDHCIKSSCVLVSSHESLITAPHGHLDTLPQTVITRF